MHLVIPFANATSPAAAHALGTLQLPVLEQLLGRMAVSHSNEGDDYLLSPPHERVLAALQGWPAEDGLLPVAAGLAAADGLKPQAGEGWALLSPTHWHVGTEQISLTDPAGLGLDDDTSLALFTALQPLFEDADSAAGWQLHWGSATRWYASHPSLAQLPSASLDRVVGRNVDLWLNDHPAMRPELRPQLRLLRRLQAEAQMLLHTHPVNEAREAAGQLPVNSFWLSGTGAALSAGTASAAKNTTSFTLDDRLRAPALAEDWAAWAEAWAALDAGPLADLLAALQAGPEPGSVQLTLCGERHARTLAGQALPWWRKLLGAGRTPAAAWLTAL